MSFEDLDSAGVATRFLSCSCGCDICHLVASCGCGGGSGVELDVCRVGLGRWPLDIGLSHR